MPVRAAHLLTVFAALLLLASAGFAAEAQPADDCSPAAAAGTAAAPFRDSGPSNSFRIVWHIGTQIEDLADAGGDPEALKTISSIRKLVDGYYFLVLKQGNLTYWPGRPRECAINFKNTKMVDNLDSLEFGGETYSLDDSDNDVQKACRKDQQDFWAEKLGKDVAADPEKAVALLQGAALGRVLENLDIRGEQRRGKIILGEMLLSNTDFDYDKVADSLTLKRLPKSYCALTSRGIAVNGVLTYQEPVMQIKQDRYLWVPRRSAAGQLLWSEDRKRDKLPENSRIIDLVGKAFDDVGAPLPGLSVNIRRWNKRRSPEIYEQLKDSPYFDGFFFEGGTVIISAGKPKLDNFADGMAWILRNTDEKIYMLMPGFWEKGQLDNEQEIDQLIDRLRQMILSLNTKLGERLKLAKGRNAICTSRMNLIPASYGAPIHVRTLPAERDGRLAGTVTGEIKLLAEIRQELCGVPN